MHLRTWRVYWRSEGPLSNILLPAIVLQTGEHVGRYLFPFRWFLQLVHIS